MKNSAPPNQGFDELIRSIYLCASGLENIGLFLKVAGEVFNSHLVGCVAANKLDGSTEIPFFMGVDESHRTQYNIHYTNKNVIAHAGLPALLSGKLVLSSDYFSDRDLARTEYYADYLKGLGAHFVAGIMISSMNEWVYTLSFARSKSLGAYSATESHWLRELRTHAEAAMHIANHLSKLKSAIKSQAYAIDHLNTGVCFLSRDLRLVEINRTARDMLEKGDLLRSESGFLRIGTSRNSRLKNLLHKLGTGAITGPFQIKIAGGHGRMSRFISVFPVLDPAEFWWVDSHDSHYVMFLDLGLAPTSHCMSVLLNECELTDRELQLVTRLLARWSLTEVAEEMCIAHETARSHLKNVFLKLDIHTQAELASIVSRLNSIH